MQRKVGEASQFGLAMRQISLVASFLRLARAVTFVSLAFTRLLRTRCLIEGKPDEMGDALRQALMELNFDQPAEGGAAPAASLPARPDPSSN